MKESKLSRRLLKIASLINEDDVIYDVGTDHGLLPCYLLDNNLCKKAYAIDNKQGPINSCKKNIKKYNLEGKVITKLSNGIDDIENDVTTVIIAGMGFHTVKRILDNHCLSNKRFIIQINRNTKDLRQYISDNHYRILNEEIVFEDHYYIIIEFTNSISKQLTRKEIYFGPILIKKKEPLFLDYLKEYRKTCISNNNKHHSDLNDYLIKTIDLIINN